MADGGVIEVIGSAAAHGNRDQGFYAGTKSAHYGLAMSHRKDPIYLKRGIDMRIIEPALFDSDIASGTVRKIRKYSSGAEPILKEKGLWVPVERCAEEVVKHMLGNGNTQVLEFPYEGCIDDFRCIIDEHTPSKQL